MWARKSGTWAPYPSAIRRPLWTFYRDKALWLRERLAGDFQT
jgi:hypothetical protein